MQCIGNQLIFHETIIKWLIGYLPDDGRHGVVFHRYFAHAQQHFIILSGPTRLTVFNVATGNEEQCGIMVVFLGDDHRKLMCPGILPPLLGGEQNVVGLGIVAKS